LPDSITRALRLAPLLVASCAACARTSAPPAAKAPPVVEELALRVVRSYPHDRQAFTQGLLWWEGKLYESTGLAGRSSLRRVELETGRPEKVMPLPAPLFAEGLARVGNHLFQLTWQDGKALVWNLRTFEREAELTYQGEGWGLCHDGKRLVMSDGSDRLVLRDAETFAKLGEVGVRRAGAPVMHLNELECVGELVYANIWQADSIARIDARTGEVTGWVDASGLLERDERPGTDVLNGIAYVPERGHFIVTGKLWPRAFEVEIVPRSAAVSRAKKGAP
jgi:glutamine cyclotransferase